MRQRTDPLPIWLPKIDQSANVLYVNCVECGARRSAAWRDKDARIAVCVNCIMNGLNSMVKHYQQQRQQERIDRAQSARLARRQRFSR
jgi:hypothetical protein